MKRRLLVILVVALSATTVTFGVTHQQAAIAQAPDEAAVREVLLKSALAFEKNDVDLITKAWANDESVTVFESGHANYGWADYRDHHLFPEMKEMKNTKYTLSDIKVKVSGNTAWATFKYAISADIGTRHVDGAGLGTAVLERRGQDWKIVHRRSSAPRRAPKFPQLAQRPDLNNWDRGLKNTAPRQLYFLNTGGMDMRRTGFLILLTLVGFGAACGTTENANINANANTTVTASLSPSPSVAANANVHDNMNASEHANMNSNKNANKKTLTGSLLDRF